MQTKLHVEIERDDIIQFFPLEKFALTKDEKKLKITLKATDGSEKNIFIFDDIEFHYNNFKRYYENDYFTIYLKYENEELKFVKTEKGYLQNSK